MRRFSKKYPFFLVSTISLMSCVVSPPIEVTPVEQNKPPFIDDVQPDARVIQVNTPNLTLSARLFDQNREAALYVAWIGKKSGFIKAGPQPILPTEDPVKGIFYEFEPAVFELSSCSNLLRTENSETIWLYVSDAALDFPNIDHIQQKKGAFLTSYSWNLVFTSDRCSNVN